MLLLEFAQLHVRDRGTASLNVLGRRRIAGDDWEKIETDLLNGQKLQGTGTAKDVMTCIKKLGCEKDFPLFCAIHKIAFEGAKPESIVDLYK